jgi:Zn-finger nucleic acid-binding protein
VAIRCPGCGDPMSVVPLPEADVCPSCAGIWVDWFDGEIGAVARRVRSATEGQSPLGATSSSTRPARRAVRRAGPATLPSEEGAPPSAALRALLPLPWQKFVQVLKALFGVR